MSGEGLSMRKIKEILLLKWACGLSHRELARSCGIGRATVSDYLRCGQLVTALLDIMTERFLVGAEGTRVRSDGGQGLKPRHTVAH